MTWPSSTMANWFCAPLQAAQTRGDLGEVPWCPCASKTMLTTHSPVVAPLWVVLLPAGGVGDVLAADLDRAEDVLDGAVGLAGDRAARRPARRCVVSIVAAVERVELGLQGRGDLVRGRCALVGVDASAWSAAGSGSVGGASGAGVAVAVAADARRRTAAPATSTGRNSSLAEDSMRLQRLFVRACPGSRRRCSGRPGC